MFIKYALIVVKSSHSLGDLSPKLNMCVFQSPRDFKRTRSQAEGVLE